MMSKRAASTTTALREIVVSKPGTRSYSPAAAQDDDSGSMITEDQGCDSNVTCELYRERRSCGEGVGRVV
jgi:hypothetical protein